MANIEVIEDTTNQVTITLVGDTANILAGNAGQAGTLVLRNSVGQNTIRFDGASAGLVAGDAGQAGTLVLRNANRDNTIRFDGALAELVAGGAGQAGTLLLRNANGQNTIRLNGALAELVAGGAGQAGTLLLRNANGQNTIRLDGALAELVAGGAGQAGNVIIRNAAGLDMVEINGDSGDIIFKNADFAEEFDVVASEESQPGTVMVLNEEGLLRPSSRAYDKRVVGVISGAGGYKPGILLDRQEKSEKRCAIALVGKVFCRATAENGPIAIGDLVTTSDVPGYAMRAEDASQAFGAVIGKALCSLKEGKGLIPILIALQ